MQDLDSALALVGTLRQEKEALRAECHELRGTVIQASHDNAALSDELVSPFRLLARISRRFFIFSKSTSLLSSSTHLYTLSAPRTRTHFKIRSDSQRHLFAFCTDAAAQHACFNRHQTFVKQIPTFCTVCLISNLNIVPLLVWLARMHARTMAHKPSGCST